MYREGLKIYRDILAESVYNLYRKIYECMSYTERYISREGS